MDLLDRLEALHKEMKDNGYRTVDKLNFNCVYEPAFPELATHIRALEKENARLKDIMRVEYGCLEIRMSFDGRHAMQRLPKSHLRSKDPVELVRHWAGEMYECICALKEQDK